jgi:transposase
MVDAMGVVRLPNQQQPDSMKEYTLEAAPAASAKEVKNEKAPKAKRIAVGIDTHLRSYQVGRKIDNAAIGPVLTFRSQPELELYLEKQLELAEEVVVVYEAGPLGYALYRALKARGMQCYVCAPDNSQQQRRRRKNNQIDARTLTSNLFNYLNGNEGALQLVRIPTQAQEQARLVSRQHDQLVKERKRLAAQGNALLLSQGYGSCKNWWRPKAFERLSQGLPDWLREMIKVWVPLLKELDGQICRAKAGLAKHCQGPRPKGVGAQSLAQLGAEVLDWGLYSTGRKIGCLAGMVPSEWSTGDSQRLGSITKVGVPAIRRIITEMVWRIVLFQPQYKSVQKYQEQLRGTNRTLKKKAVVAIGRQLMVDLWRLQTGRIRAQELNLVMIDG